MPSRKCSGMAKGVWIWIGLAVAAAIIVAGCGCVEEKKGEKNITIETPQIPAGAITEKLMEKYTIEKLESMAYTIVIGDVIDILPSRWSTQDGKKPVETENASYVIYTDVIIKVENYLKNPLNIDNITVRVLGGTVGGESLEVEDQPYFKLNEKILIFLERDNDPRTKNIGPEHFVTAGLFQGKATIEDGKVTIGDERKTVNELIAKFSGEVNKTIAKG